jgi:APA family basic amino acid/polyamine antiporter
LKPHSELKRGIGLLDATTLVVGSMIGSGIFIVSAESGRVGGSPGWLLAAWAIAGTLTMLAALSCAELAAMLPEAGGQYVFFREAYGPLFGFLFGWTMFLVVQTGTIAAVSVAFAKFLGVLWPAISGDSKLVVIGRFSVSSVQAVGLVVIAVLTASNATGLKTGTRTQNVLTFAKFSALFALTGLGLLLGKAGSLAVASADFWRSVSQSGQDRNGLALIAAVATAMVGPMFSQSAWNNVTFAAAEVKNPQRNLPLSLLLGTGLVSLLYVLANVAYLNTLPLVGTADGATVMARGIQHATQDRVGTAAAEVLFGSSGTVLMASAILLSTFGCANGLILAGARVYYAMARDGLFFKRVGTLNARAVPSAGLIVQSVWVSLLCLTGTYGQLLNYVIFAALVFYVLTTIGLFILRVKRPDADRPYRAVGYPALPALYMLLAAAVAVILLIAPKTRTEALSGLALVLIGIPVYFIWRRVEAS